MAVEKSNLRRSEGACSSRPTLALALPASASVGGRVCAFGIFRLQIWNCRTETREVPRSVVKREHCVNIILQSGILHNLQFCFF
jgi:hypothetical protein